MSPFCYELVSPPVYKGKGQESSFNSAPHVSAFRIRRLRTATIFLVTGALFPKAQFQSSLAAEGDQGSEGFPSPCPNSCLPGFLAARSPGTRSPPTPGIMVVLARLDVPSPAAKLLDFQVVFCVRFFPAALSAQSFLKSYLLPTLTPPYSRAAGDCAFSCVPSFPTESQ